MATTGLEIARTRKLMVDAVAIDNITSIQMTLDRATIDITSYDSVDWADIDVALKTWSFTVECFYEEAATEGFNEFWSDLDGGTTVALLYTTEVVGDVTLAGNAKVTSAPLNGSLGEGTKFTITFSGNGAMTKGTVSA